jgi:hypothetical protein
VEIEMAKTKAEIDFVQRAEHYNENADGTCFKGWYHQADVARLLWAQFHSMEAAKTSEIIEPFSFGDGIDQLPLSVYLTPLMRQLQADAQKKYYPFVFKPETCSKKDLAQCADHYMAGFLRKNEGKPSFSLFVFNPLGSPPRVDLGTFKDNPELIEVVSSPHPIQSIEKDDGTLTSCGPLSLAFVTYLLNNPAYMASLDSNFALPESFAVFLENKSTYQTEVLALRQRHKEVLAQLLDDDLNKVDEASLEMTVALCNAAQEHWRLNPPSIPNPPKAVQPVSYSLALLPSKTVAPRTDNASFSSNKTTAKTDTRQDVQFVQEQIARLRKNPHHFFSMNRKKKALRLETALNKALESQVKDVRADAAVLKALKSHRVLGGFFGLMKTRAMKMLDKSLKAFPLMR